MEHTDGDGIQYYEYIQSDAWAGKVTEAKRRANYRCQICNRHEEDTILNGHHRTYERLGREFPEDVIILCRDCHELYEKNKRLAKYGTAFQVRKPMYQIGTLVAKVIAAAAEPRQDGLYTGFELLDRIVHWRRGTLAVVVGRPGIGTSAFVNSVALNAAKHHSASVVHFSLKTTAEQLSTRLLGIETAVESRRLSTGNIDEEEWPLVLEAAELLGKLPFSIDETVSQTLDGIREKCFSELVERGAIDLVVIDGGELLVPNVPSGSRNRDRERDAHSVARELKSIAMETNTLVMVTLPADGAVDRRSDKRPFLTDIPDAWSQIADVILGVYREECYVKNTDRPNIIDLLVMKNRDGDTGTISLFFEKELGYLRGGALTPTPLDY